MPCKNAAKSLISHILYFIIGKKLAKMKMNMIAFNKAVCSVTDGRVSELLYDIKKLNELYGERQGNLIPVWNSQR